MDLAALHHKRMPKFFETPSLCYKNALLLQNANSMMHFLDNRYVAVVLEVDYFGIFLCDCYSKGICDIDTQIRRSSCIFGSIQEQDFSNPNVKFFFVYTGLVLATYYMVLNRGVRPMSFTNASNTSMLNASVRCVKSHNEMPGTTTL